MSDKTKLLSVVICSVLMSAQAWAAAGWTSTGTVAELTPTTSGRFLVKLDLESNPTDCRNKQWFYSDYTGTGSDHMFRAILGAITSEKRVRVYVTGRCDLDGYSEISSATVLR